MGRANNPQTYKDGLARRRHRSRERKRALGISRALPLDDVLREARLAERAQKAAQRASDRAQDTARKKTEAEDKRIARQAVARSKPWNDPSLNQSEKWAIRYKLDPEFRLHELLRTRMRKKLKGQALRWGEHMRTQILSNGRSRKFERVLGYSMAELRNHLERQFRNGMSWDYMRSGDIHIDHIIPLSSFDLSKPEEARSAWALSNLRPLWARENLAKGDRRTLLL